MRRISRRIAKKTLKLGLCLTKTATSCQWTPSSTTIRVIIVKYAEKLKTKKGIGKDLREEPMREDEDRKREEELNR